MKDANHAESGPCESMKFSGLWPAVCGVTE